MHVAGQEWESALDIHHDTQTSGITPIPMGDFAGQPEEFVRTPSFGKQELNTFHERHVRRIRSDLQCFSDGFFVMIVAQLNGAARVHLLRGLVDILVVVTDHSRQRIQEKLQGLEERKARGVVLCNREDVGRDIVREVVNAIQDGNLALISFYPNILSIDK